MATSDGLVQMVETLRKERDAALRACDEMRSVIRLYYDECQCQHEGIESANMRGYAILQREQLSDPQARERSLIVEWLRREYSEQVDEMTAAIERGEHLAKRA